MSNKIAIYRSKTGNSWDSNPVESSFYIDGSADTDMPSLAVFDNKVFCAQKEAGAGAQSLWFEDYGYDGRSILHPTKVSGVTSLYSPSLGVLDGKLYMVYMHSDRYLHYCVFDPRENGFGDDVKLSDLGQWVDPTKPTVATLNNELHIFQKGTDNTLWHSTLFPTGETGLNYPISGTSVAGPVSASVFRDKIVVIYKESPGLIPFPTYAYLVNYDGNTWSYPTLTPELGNSVSIFVYRNLLYLTMVPDFLTSGRLFLFSTYDGNAFSPPRFATRSTVKEHVRWEPQSIATPAGILTFCALAPQ